MSSLQAHASICWAYASLPFWLPAASKGILLDQAGAGGTNGWRRGIGVALCILVLIGCLTAVAFAVGRDKLVKPRELRFFVVSITWNSLPSNTSNTCILC